MIGIKLIQLRLPVLMVLANDDRMADNIAIERVFETMRAAPKRLEKIPGEHGIQFDAADQVVSIMAEWLSQPPTGQ